MDRASFYSHTTVNVIHTTLKVELDRRGDDGFDLGDWALKLESWDGSYSHTQVLIWLSVEQVGQIADAFRKAEAFLEVEATEA